MNFDKFKGINKEREIKEREDGCVEALLDACNKVIQKYKSKIIAKPTSGLNDVYLSMHAQLKESIPSFCNEDLQNLILAKANQEHDDTESRALGLYTSVLLQILTERNNAKGERTRTYINGRGSKFDYLFLFAKEADELVIDSFIGNHICKHAGSHEGNIGTLAIVNTQGEDLVSFAGSDRGNIGTLVFNKSLGDDLGTGAGKEEGKIGTMLINECVGDGIAFRAGSFTGNIKKAIITNSRGHRLVRFAGSSEGNIENLIIINHEGGYIAQEAGNRQGNVGTIVVANSKGNLAACDLGSDDGKIGKIVLYNNESPGQALGSHANQIIFGEEAYGEYKKILKEYKLNKIMQLAESLQGKKEQELFDILDKINTIYESKK